MPLVSSSSDAVLQSPQAEVATNNAEANLVEPEVHRAVQRSRSAEQLEVENARNAADKQREIEARKRRNTVIARAIGITTGGDGTTGDAKAPTVKDVTISGLNPKKSTSVDVPGVILTVADPTEDKASVKRTSFDKSDTTETRLTVTGVGSFRPDPATGKLDFAPVACFLGGQAQAGVTIANVSMARRRSRWTLTRGPSWPISSSRPIWHRSTPWCSACPCR